jgi:hypothetical protein
MANEELWFNLDQAKWNAEQRKRNDVSAGKLVSRLVKFTGEKRMRKLWDILMKWKSVYDAHDEIYGIYTLYGQAMVSKFKKVNPNLRDGIFCQRCGRHYRMKRWRRYFSKAHNYEVCHRCLKEWYDERGKRVDEWGLVKRKPGVGATTDSLLESTRTLARKLDTDQHVIHQCSSRIKASLSQPSPRSSKRRKGARKPGAGSGKVSKRGTR